MSLSVLEKADVDASFDAVNTYFYEQRWTDGLPVVPPTRERVEAMLAAAPAGAPEEFGAFPPRWRNTTLEHLAINSVMAGCLPEYFPVVISAIQAMLDPAFNLYGVQATTNPCGVVLVVNGPIAQTLDINSGFNLFGTGWRANTAIGRAVRLCMLNIGGAIPGIGDMATLGNPNKYGSCFAETVVNNPWESFNSEHGYAAEASTVSVISAVAPQNIIALSADGRDVLDTIAAALQSSGSNAVRHWMQAAIVIGPVHATHIARAGFDKASIRRWLWERSKITIDHLPKPDLYAVRGWKKQCIHIEAGREVMYVTEKPEDLEIFVAGGTVGHQSAILPAFNHTRIVTREIGVFGPA